MFPFEIMHIAYYIWSFRWSMVHYLILSGGGFPHAPDPVHFELCSKIVYPLRFVWAGWAWEAIDSSRGQARWSMIGIYVHSDSISKNKLKNELMIQLVQFVPLFFCPIWIDERRPEQRWSLERRAVKKKRDMCLLWGTKKKGYTQLEITNKGNFKWCDYSVQSFCFILSRFVDVL